MWIERVIIFEGMLLSTYNIFNVFGLRCLYEDFKKYSVRINVDYYVMRSQNG